MTAQDYDYRMELQLAMLDCELYGDIDGAEIYQQMIDELDAMEV